MTITSYITSPAVYTVTEPLQLLPLFPEFDGYIPLSPPQPQNLLQLRVTHTSTLPVSAAGPVTVWRLGLVYYHTTPLFIARRADEQDKWPTRIAHPSLIPDAYLTALRWVHKFYQADPDTGDLYPQAAWGNVEVPPLPNPQVPLGLDEATWASLVKYAQSRYRLEQTFPT